jgi:hypothetical protein
MLPVALQLRFSARSLLRKRGWRSLGIDVSAWQEYLDSELGDAPARTCRSAAFWEMGGTLELFPRGGTTGEDHRQGGYATRTTALSLLQETMTVRAGYESRDERRLFAGTSHFFPADILASTLNSDSVTTAVNNTGTTRPIMLQMAGMDASRFPAAGLDRRQRRRSDGQ